MYSNMNCEFCTKTFTNRNQLFLHYKTISHIEKTEVNINFRNIWGKYVLEELPTPYEREFLYKFCQRNWTEKIGDRDNHYRIKNGNFPDYVSDFELYAWFNQKILNDVENNLV